MAKNLGTADRIVRFIAGVALVYLGYSVFDNALVKILLVAIGLISIAESIVSYCGIYRLLRINTHKK